MLKLHRIKVGEKAPKIPSQIADKKKETSWEPFYAPEDKVLMNGTCMVCGRSWYEAAKPPGYIRSECPECQDKYK